jgi:hypothetical protein
MAPFSLRSTGANAAAGRCGTAHRLDLASGVVNGLVNEIRYRFGLYRPTSTMAGGMLSSPHIARARNRSLGCPSTSTDLMTSIKTADFLAGPLWAGTAVYATAVTERHIVNKLRRI